MSLQVGRVGIDVALDDPEEWEHDGDRVRWSGQMHTPDLGDFTVLREQLLGLVDSQDEPVVPVAWSEDPTQDGYYRVLGAKVDYYGMSLVTYMANIEVDLERVHGFATPLTEVTQIGNIRTNSHGVATASAISAFYFGALEQFHDTLMVSSTRFIDAPLGGAALSVGYTAGLTAAQTIRSTANVSLTSHYYGACLVENLKTLPSTYRNVVGRQVGLSSTHWRLSNGLIRVRPYPTTHALGYGLYFEHFDTANGWESEKLFIFDPVDGATSVAQPTEAIILRNSPESAVVRMCCPMGTTGFMGRLYLDIKLTRGDRIARITATSDKHYLWAVYQGTTPEACTAVTGGIRATANDAAGNRFQVLTSKSKTNTLASAKFALNAATQQFDVGFGFIYSGAASPDLSADLIDQYFWANDVRQRIVTR